jgi:hypothetical protein
LIIQEAEPGSSIYERVGFALVHKEWEFKKWGLGNSKDCDDVDSDFTDDSDLYERRPPKLVKTWREFLLR